MIAEKQLQVDKRYLRMAMIWAENSCSKRLKVGALLVKDTRIISDGYNGTPSGFDNCCETLTCSSKFNDGTAICGMPPDCQCNKVDCEFAKLTTKPHVLHAEANAITKVARSTNSSEGSTLYVTDSPCIECSKLIIQAGIKRVVYARKYRLEDGLNLLKQAGIEVEQIDNQNEQ